MGVLKGFLYFCAAAFAVGGLLIGLLVAKATWIIGLPIIAIGAGLGWVTYKAARNYGVKAGESQGLQFEQTYRQLAAKAGGAVSVDALTHATGESKDTVQAKMRELMGRGVCEMDFGPNGEMLFRLTPMDEARAQLAGMNQPRERTH